MRVVCIGECMVEFLRQEDGLWRQGFAGDSLNVAWALRALLPGAVRVDYLTRVGSDGLSQAMVDMFDAAGIGTGWISRDDRRTVGLYTIATDPAGERSFSYWRSDSAARALAQDARHLGRALEGADLIYLSGITLAILPPPGRAQLLAALARHRAGQARVAFDPNFRRRLWSGIEEARQSLAAMAAGADILLPTHEDEMMAFGDADAAATRARYKGLGVPEVIVKDGARPTLWHLAGAEGASPVHPARRVVDTTGAGDSFNGAYLAATLAGQPVARAVALAQAVSARVIGERGALLPPDALRQAFAPVPADPLSNPPS